MRGGVGRGGGVESVTYIEGVERDVMRAVDGVSEVVRAKRAAEEGFVFDGREGGERVGGGRGEAIVAVGFSPELAT